MGLELVELVVSLEHDFGIPIPDADAERLQTAGAIAAYFGDRLGAFVTAPSQCVSHRAFNELRATFVARADVPLHRVRPDALLRDVVNGSARRWHDVAVRLLLPRARSGLLWLWDHRSIPANARVRDLVRHRVERGPYRFTRGGAVDHPAVWRAVAQRVGEVAGMDPGLVRPEMGLITDLRLG